MTDIEIIALHECAHFVVSSALGHNSCPVIFDEPQPQANGRTVAGQCLFDPIARPTEFQGAVVAWAGIIIEGLLGITYTLEMPFRLSKATMRDCYRVVMANFERLSLGDQTLIAKHKDTWRSFKSSFRIVTKHKRRILRLARLMVENKTKEQMTHSAQAPAKSFADLAAPIQVPLHVTAQAIATHLAGLPPDHPDRAKFEAALSPCGAASGCRTTFSRRRLQPGSQHESAVRPRAGSPSDPSGQAV